MRPRNVFTSWFFFAAILLGILLLFASSPRSVLACEPTPVIPGYTPPTPIPLETQVAGSSQSAQIVLEGTLESWIPGSDMNSILTVQVEQYLKGHGPKTVQISGYFWECAPNFALQTGSRYVFFVDGDPASTEPLQARNWFVSQETVVTSVRNSSGQRPSAPEGTYDLLWFSLPLVILLGLIVFFRYRRWRSNESIQNQ